MLGTQQDKNLNYSRRPGFPRNKNSKALDLVTTSIGAARRSLQPTRTTTRSIDSSACTMARSIVILICFLLFAAG
jgi:hypothetical protein